MTSEPPPREAQLLATLQHPHLASVYGFERADDSAFLVMELVEGQDLSEFIGGSELAVEEVLDLAAQVAEGLAALLRTGGSPRRFPCCASSTMPQHRLLAAPWTHLRLPPANVKAFATWDTRVVRRLRRPH